MSGKERGDWLADWPSQGRPTAVRALGGGEGRKEIMVRIW